MEKDYLSKRDAVKATSSWTHKDVNSERGSEQFIEIGFDKEVFSRPKPLGTLLRIIEIATYPNEKCIALDFLAVQELLVTLFSQPMQLRIEKSNLSLRNYQN